MADLVPSERPLETLPAMFTLALVQTGKFFRDAASHDPQDLAFARRSISRAIQPAHEKFHHALDEIEIEIIRAKSVLERDLALIRSKRAERNKAQEAVKLRDSYYEKKGVIGIEEEKQQQGESQSIIMGAEQTKHNDVIMIDDEETVTSTPALDEGKPITVLDGAEINYTNQAVSKIRTGAINSNGLARIVDSSPASEVPNSSKVLIVGQSDSINQLEQPTETPTTANPRESDFETMFDDTEAIRTQELDFGLDFTTGPHDLNDTSFENGPTQNEDVINLNTASNEDINTLLPGLENYVNASDDFANIGFAADTTLPNNNSAKAKDPLAPQALEPVLAGSNFDDLFHPTSNFMEDADDYEMDGTGGINGLEDLDNWFV